LFPQQRSWQRAERLTYGLLSCLRQHLTSTAICATGRQFVDWSADYRLFWRSPWEATSLFNPVFDHLHDLSPPDPSAPVLAALDDTTCKKTGRHIPGVATVRDPQSLPFHVNLCRGLRFVQLSLLVSPLETPGPARGLPVRFQPAPLPPKPKKNALPEAWNTYKQEKKKCRLTLVGVAAIHEVRRSLDARPSTRQRQLLVSGDGSYTNSPVLKHLPERTTFIGRIRKDAQLHSLPSPAPSLSKGRRKQYGPAAPTPQQLLQDDSVPFQSVRCYATGQTRDFQIKVLRPVLWPKAGADRPLVLVVIKAVGYRLRAGARLLYRQPAFLICTDPDFDLQQLLQAYIYRWEIECNHRDEKSLLGVAKGQVRNPLAVARLPQFQVAGYSLLLLASLLTYGFARTPDYLPLPKWRTKSIRPSLLDLLNLLRDQLFEHSADSPLSRLSFARFMNTPAPIMKPSKLPLASDTLCTVAA
jgi:hypothetical protein